MTSRASVISLFLAGILYGCGGSEPEPVPETKRVLHEGAVDDVAVTVDSDEFGVDWVLRVAQPTLVPIENVLSMYLFKGDCETVTGAEPHIELYGAISYDDINQVNHLRVRYAPYTGCFTVYGVEVTELVSCDHLVEGDLRVEMDEDELRIRFTDVVFTCHPEHLGPWIDSIRLDGLYTAPLESIE